LKKESPNPEQKEGFVFADARKGKGEKKGEKRKSYRIGENRKRGKKKSVLVSRRE